jgi:hypothetical protein
MEMLAFMALWLYGFMALWLYGFMALMALMALMARKLSAIPHGDQTAIDSTYLSD